MLSPLELCDVNGDGLPDILIVFTALMNASVMGKHCSSFPLLFMCQYRPLDVCLTHRKGSCHCKSTALLFSEFLKIAGVQCLWLVMLKISLQACAPVPFGQHHPFALTSSWGSSISLSCICTHFTLFLETASLCCLFLQVTPFTARLQIIVN